MLKFAVFSLSLAIHRGAHAEISSHSSVDKESFLLMTPTHDLSEPSQTTRSEDPLFFLSFHSPTGPLSTNIPGIHLDSGKTVTVTLTVPVSTSTVTEYITLSAIASSIETVNPASTRIFLPSTSAPLSTQPSGTVSQSSWFAPPQMTDLSSFNIMSFPSGRKNLRLVSSLEDSSRTHDSPDNQSLVQVLYPAHSVNPAQSPVGGASFYASPLELSSATNVTFRYSVYFPADFYWVKGGKLPGLYGGHTGCSGGSEAEDCFSTRLMWRADGVGELYLYAPKSHLSQSLCSSTGSTCNMDYGFSIGRGSFSWTRGAWTTVTQTIVLNSGGEANGWFTLDVNGKVVISRRDVYYRHGGQRPITIKPTKSNTEPSVTKTMSQPTETKDGSLLGGILNPLLGHSAGSRGILSGSPGLLAGHMHYRGPDRHQQLFYIDSSPRHDDDQPRARDMFGIEVNVPPLISVSAGLGSDSGGGGEKISVTVGLGAGSGIHDNEDKERLTDPAGLVGIFFSTFFGGHEESYATPKDQYVWFKDFALIINA